MYLPHHENAHERRSQASERAIPCWNVTDVRSTLLARARRLRRRGRDRQRPGRLGGARPDPVGDDEADPGAGAAPRRRPPRPRPPRGAPDRGGDGALPGGAARARRAGSRRAGGRRPPRRAAAADRRQPHRRRGAAADLADRLPVGAARGPPAGRRRQLAERRSSPSARTVPTSASSRASTRSTASSRRSSPATEIVLVVAAGHRWANRRAVAPRELAGGRWISREEGSGTRTVADAALAAVGVELEPDLSLASLEGVKRSLAAGGFALISELALEPDLGAGRLVKVPLKDLRIERALTAIRRPAATPRSTRAASGPGCRRSIRAPRRRGYSGAISDHVYSVSEIVGTSPEGSSRRSTMRSRGRADPAQPRLVRDDRDPRSPRRRRQIDYWQVTLKLGFRME